MARVYLIDARHLAGYDEFEAWTVVADGPESAWQLIESNTPEQEMPNYWGDKPQATLADCAVADLGPADDPNPRIVFAAFLKG